MTLIIQKPTGAKLNLAKTYVGIDDPDAAVYVAAVEAADGQSLETATKVAIHSFVKGCKNDGIWPAIKASCILAGARTLNGALVPLVGAAPTNFNFVAGDYNRKTGLLGDGSTKYLDSNRNNNADPQNSKHISAYASVFSGVVSEAIIGTTPAQGNGSTSIYSGASNGSLGVLNVNSSSASNATLGAGFIGLSRSSASSFNTRASQATSVLTNASTTPRNANIFVFRVTAAVFGTHRLAFYSIGESLDLALLDDRVTDLINAIGAAIP